MGGKMYKVWNCSRTVKKSLVAASLTELLRKGSEKLGYAGAGTGAGSGAVTVVLEEDGTRVEDDEYFELLEQNTTFILLTAGETWQPAWQTVPFNQHTVAAAAAEDTVDHAAAAAADVTSIAHLAEILRSDLTRLVTFSTQQLQELASASPSHLASLLGPGGEERGAEAIIACCQRHLDAQLEADEAITLLRSLKAAAAATGTQGAGEGDGDGNGQGDGTVEREGEREDGPGAEKRPRLDT